MAVAFTVTALFHADVDAQGGAYATGVLVLMTSGACAVTISSWRTAMGLPFLLIALVFIYTTGANIQERPEGLHIASIFIFVMISTSLLSRALRSTELRIRDVQLDPTAAALLAEDEDQVIHIIAKRPRPPETEAVFDEAAHYMRGLHNLSPTERIYFLQVERGDASEFEHVLHVTGARVGQHAVLRATSPAIANSIAAFLVYLEKTTGHCPHAYFHWTEGNPIGNVLRFLVLGEGDVAPLVHEVLRRAVPDPQRRPIIHVS
jgi:hypothetical protein